MNIIEQKRAEQMEAARLLQNEFRQRPPSRGGARGGGRGGYVSTGPRHLSYRMEPAPVYRTSMTRPLPSQASHQENYRHTNSPAPAPAPAKVNKTFADWLDDAKPTKPTAAPEALAPVVATSTGPSTAAAAVAAPAATVPAATVPAAPSATAPVATAPVAAASTHAAPPHATPASCGRNGIEKGMWASNGTNGAKPHMTKTGGSSSPADLTEPKKDKVDEVHVGQATRLLAGMDSSLAKSKDDNPTTSSSDQVEDEAEFGTPLWAFQQLEKGLSLPSENECRARLEMSGVKGQQLQSPSDTTQTEMTNRPVSAKMAMPQSCATEEIKKTAGRTEEIKKMLHKSACSCPKRMRPVVGLGASKYNTDADGDMEVSDMSSSAAKRKFAVNVILQDHPLPGCPILEEAMTKYPLAFGANPAGFHDPTDVFEVILWSSKNAAAESSTQRKPSGHGQGLMASMWAD